LKKFISFLFLFITFLNFQVKGSELFIHRKLSWNSNTVHIIEIKNGAALCPAVEKTGLTVPEFVKKFGAVAAINGGYFNHSDGWPVSHVIINGLLTTKPEKNKALTANQVLKPILPKIFSNRVELRILKKWKLVKWVIQPHSANVEKGWFLLHSLQAGPELLPEKNLVNEGFIIKNKNGKIVRDGIGSQGLAARSALGITKNGEILFVTVSGKKGITINQLANLMSELKVSSAMALDGGSSTTLVWKENENIRTFVGSSKTPAQVNSALLVFPN
jgi:hypothetical protein